MMIAIPKPGRRRAFRVLLPASLALAAFLVSGHLRRAPSSFAETVTFAPSLPFHPRLVQAPAGTERLDPPVPRQRELARGESLDLLLSDLGLDANDRQEALAVLREQLDVRRLRPGLTAVALARAGRVESLELTVRDRGHLRLASDGAPGNWTATWAPFAEHRELRTVAGEIDGSLVGALSDAGAPASVAYRMADVLQWDVDFSRDLRRGDRFEVLYTELRREGSAATVEDLAAVRLWNRGRLVEAYQFADAGYFDGEGRPLKKMFLRSPLAFSRVTSRFTSRRFHPVLKVYRPHYGVDYGAPEGTPVKVTANGVVSFVGWDRGGGKTIKVRHANGYVTAYLHLSGYARGLKTGQRVGQGEVIGFVGSTGLATGAHLDYRVQHRGRWIDPLSIKSVPAEPVRSEDLPVFLAWRDELRTALEKGSAPDRSFEEVQLASLGRDVAGTGDAVAGGR